MATATFCLLLLGCNNEVSTTPDGGGLSTVDASINGDSGSSPSDGGTNTVDAGSNDTSDIPTTRAAMVALAQDGGYLSWKHEANIHGSSGPHGAGVRTYVNDVLYTSLKSGAAAHPVGSIAVKELYDNTQRRTGWAINAKGPDRLWTYFEGYEPTLDQYFFRGGSNVCSTCHVTGGVDAVMVTGDQFP